MDKKYAYGLTALVALAIIAILVFKSGNGKSDKYIELVPANSTIVNYTDIMSLVKKSDIANNGIGEKMTSGNAISDVLKKYLDDPKKIGLDARKPVYIFANANDSTTGIAIKMLDDDDFGNFLSDLHKEDGVISEVSEKDGLQTASLAGYGCVAFNEDAALILVSGKNKPEKTTTKACQLFKLKPEEQFAKTPDFKRMKAAKGDSRTYLSMDLLMELPNHISFISLPDSSEIKKMRLMLDTQFNKGEASITGEIYSNDTATARLLTDKWKNIRHVKGDYLSLMDSKGFLFLTESIDGATIVKEMDREAKAYGDLGNLLKSAHEQELFAKIKNIIKEADGDAALSIGLTRDGMVPIAIHLAAKMKGTNFLADGDYWMRQANRYSHLEFGDFDMDDEQPRPEVMTKLDNNTYVLTLMGIQTKVGVDGGNTFYLTTKESASDMLKQPVNSSLAAQKKDVTNSYGYALIDLKTAKPLIEEVYGTQTPFSTVANVIESITLNVCDINKGVLKLNMTDHQSNALKQLVELYLKVE